MAPRYYLLQYFIAFIYTLLSLSFAPFPPSLLPSSPTKLSKLQLRSLCYRIIIITIIIIIIIITTVFRLLPSCFFPLLPSLFPVYLLLRYREGKEKKKNQSLYLITESFYLTTIRLPLRLSKTIEFNR